VDGDRELHVYRLAALLAGLEVHFLDAADGFFV
jgi:hypothetical protein